MRETGAWQAIDLLEGEVGWSVISSAVAGMVWTRLGCSRCRYVSEHPGAVVPGDLDRECGLCRAPLGAVTVFRIGEGTSPGPLAVLTTG